MHNELPLRARPWLRLSVIALAALMAGCANLSPDGGFGPVEQLAKERTGQPLSYQRHATDTTAAQARVNELLAQPLAPDSAVELALLNNRGLQARLQALGMAEADLVQVGRLGNPTLAFSYKSGSGHVEIERSLMFNVLGLLTMPTAQRVEKQRFEAAQLQAAQAAVALAADTRRAWFSAVAAQELLTYFEQVKDAADASGELARRMLQAGNFSKLAQMREQAFEADAKAQLARARHQSVAERERLTRLLGLSGPQLTFKLPERLPELPNEPEVPQNAEQMAMDKRLDVLMAKRDTEALAQSLGLTQATRFVNVLHAGFQNASTRGEPTVRGYEIELELPLFDFGGPRLARAEAQYMQAVHHTAEVAVNAQSEVREAYSAYRSAHELAKHFRDEVVPLRKRIAEENLLRYNGMLIGVFELLADARTQVSGVTGHVEALRDFWMAQTDLQTALTAGKPAGGALVRPTSSAAADGAAH